MRQRASATPDRWARRGLAGFGVRILVVAVPFACAVATIAVLGRVMPTPGAWGSATRYALIFASSWVVMAVTHRALHRLLPLAALLEMSLLFPETAPSRLRLARRVASRRDLEDLAAGRTARPDESTQEAAERILSLVSALSEHDRGTRGHSERVRVLTDLIAERLGLSQHDRDRLRWAALLHDIGKLQVPVSVLNKPARPSPQEWEVLRRHPHHGELIAAPLLHWLGGWGDVIVQHHEKWDGSGYPMGLSGQGICLGARIVSVADAFDVMTAARAYKKPVGRVSALRELVASSGTHFDPDVVRALITLPQRRMLLAMGPVSWLTGLPLVGQAPSAVSATFASQAGVAVGAVALTGTAALTPFAGTPRAVSDEVPVRPRVSVTSTVDPSTGPGGVPGGSATGSPGGAAASGTGSSPGDGAGAGVAGGDPSAVGVEGSGGQGGTGGPTSGAEGADGTGGADGAGGGVDGQSGPATTAGGPTSSTATRSKSTKTTRTTTHGPATTPPARTTPSAPRTTPPARTTPSAPRTTPPTRTSNPAQPTSTPGNGNAGSGNTGGGNTGGGNTGGGNTVKGNAAGNGNGGTASAGHTGNGHT